jgi:peptidoglycan/xylan/chitin deacetylase (PgdA/CDA1 family)
VIAPVPILVYHRIDGSGGPFSTSPAAFASHLSWLSRHGFETLTASELTAVLIGEAGRPAGRAVAITFDDGYADLETEVAPALRCHGFRATSFLITGRCPSEPQPGGEYLAWSTARMLAQEGVLEFHSHTDSHGRWDLGPDQAAEVVDEVADDIAASLTTLSAELGQPRTAFDQLAWPWGRTCPAWEEAAAALGVRSQYVVQRGAADRSAVCRRLPRLLVDGASTAALARWMQILSNGAGARAANTVFGAIRQQRQGAGYR